MRYAVIKDGKVQNLIEAPADYRAAGVELVAAANVGSIGDDYVGGKIIPVAKAPKPKSPKTLYAEAVTDAERLAIVARVLGLLPEP